MRVKYGVKNPYDDTEIPNLSIWLRSNAKSKKRLDAPDLTELRFLVYRHNFGEIASREKMYELYVQKEYTLPKMLREFGMSYEVTLALLEYHGIKKRTMKDSANLKTVREGYKKTCLERFGYENVSQAAKVKKKKERSAIKKYGFKNVFQAPEIKEKLKATMLEKYGVINNIHREGRKMGCGSHSGLQTEIAVALTAAGLSIKEEVRGKCPAFNPVLKKEYSPILDIMIEGTNIAIEVYGDRWHANPKKYKKTDMIPLYKGDCSAEDIWAFDESREKQIRSHGLFLIVVWEGEYRSNKQKTIERIKNEIKNHLNKKD